jgi:hypothetical protein
MSSPLDGRIRALARDEATMLLAGASAGSDDINTDRVTALEEEVTSLRNTLLRAEARIGALEKAAGQAEQEARSATRRTRGSAG